MQNIALRIYFLLGYSDALPRMVCALVSMVKYFERLFCLFLLGFFFHPHLYVAQKTWQPIYFFYDPLLKKNILTMLTRESTV